MKRGLFSSSRKQHASISRDVQVYLSNITCTLVPVVQNKLGQLGELTECKPKWVPNHGPSFLCLENQICAQSRNILTRENERTLAEHSDIYIG